MQYLTVDELALLLKRSRGTILADRSRNPSAVPPAIRLPNTRHLLWDADVVRAWLRAQAESHPIDQTEGLPAEATAIPAQPPKKRGRPRKVL